jgi:hypothetical protein
MARLATDVHVKDPQTRLMVHLRAGEEPAPEYAALVKNPDAWEGGKLPTATKNADSPAPSDEDGKDDGDKPTAKRAAKKPARGRSAADESSPPTRGCSDAEPGRGRPVVVLPADAGVLRVPRAPAPRSTSPPRRPRMRHLTLALPPQYAARLFDAQNIGAGEQQLRAGAAEGLGEMYFRDGGRRAHGLEVEFTDGTVRDRPVAPRRDESGRHPQSARRRVARVPTNPRHRPRGCSGSSLPPAHPCR